MVVITLPQVWKIVVVYLEPDIFFENEYFSQVSKVGGFNEGLEMRLKNSLFDSEKENIIWLHETS